MRQLLPERYISYIYRNLNVNGIESIIELTIISAKLINSSYTIVLYESFKTDE